MKEEKRRKVGRKEKMWKEKAEKDGNAEKRRNINKNCYINARKELKEKRAERKEIKYEGKLKNEKGRKIHHRKKHE